MFPKNGKKKKRKGNWEKTVSRDFVRGEKEGRKEGKERDTRDGRGLFAAYEIFHEVGKGTGTVMAGTRRVIDRA